MVNQELSEHMVNKGEVDTIDKNEADEGKDGEDGDSSFMSDYLFQADQLHFRSLLPEEMWRMILNKLKDSPEDMESCANASPYFRELLSGHRVLFLFPKILGILIDRYNPTEWQMTRITGQEAEETFEGLMEIDAGQENLDKNLQEDVTDEEVNNAVLLDSDQVATKQENLKKWGNTVLTCRQVCATWNQSVEHCYEKPKSRFRIDSVQKAQHCMQHFEMSHHSAQNPKNPFYRRYLRIDLENAELNLEELIIMVSRLLQMFGDEVWDLFLVGSYVHNNEDRYLKYKEWFELMPNLKKIKLMGVYYDKLSQEFVNQNPLPKLENLEELRTSNNCGGSIVSELIKKNSHIQTLDFFDAQALDEDVGSSLSSLTDFSASLSELSVDKMVERFGSRWKLNKVNLIGDYKKMFNLVGNWKDSLTELILSVYVYTAVRETELLNDSKNLRLDLPCLRQLFIRIGGLVLLDFILPLANSLEYLEIKTEDPENVDLVSNLKARDELARGQVIQFAGFERKMHQSNIWKLFSKLKAIQMTLGLPNSREYFVFTRKGEKLVYRRKQ